MTDDYTPLTDEQVAAMEIRDEAAFLVHPAEIDRAALLADRDYWKRRAEAAERVDKCHGCHGRGWLLYPKTTTYMHGVGGNVMTKDVCEVCWGSGDERNPFRNLREVMQAWGDAERRARAPQ